MASVILFVFIILFASILQTSTGFGFSIMATPFLLLLFDVREAVQINLILSLVISCALIIKVKKDVDVNVLKRLIFGSTVGLVIGIIIFLMADMTGLKIGIGILILVLTVLLVLKFRINQKVERDFVVGGVSGMLTTSIGMAGPPLLLYFSGTNTSKEKLRGTVLAFYLFVYLVSLIMQVVFAGTNKLIWLSSLQALPIIGIGLFLGQKMFKKINQEIFRIVTYVLLLLTGMYLLIQQII